MPHGGGWDSSSAAWREHEMRKAQVPAEYRYRITHVWGSLTDQLKAGDVIVEKEDMGSEHTWTIMNLTTGEVTSTFTGKRIREDAEA